MNKYKSLVKIIYSIIASELTLIILFGILSIFKITIIETNLKPLDFRNIPAIGGEILFFIDDDQIIKSFINIPYVEEIKIIKKIPNTVIVNAKYREKVAEITGSNGTFGIDINGIIFEKIASSSGFTNINLKDRELSLNNNITQKNIIIPLRMTKLLKNTELRIININPISDNEIILILISGIQIVIDSNNNPEEIVSSLQMIARRFTIEGKSISKIDFRFDKPIVTF